LLSFTTNVILYVWNIQFDWMLPLQIQMEWKRGGACEG
jgi:hypothetical protein